MGRRYVISGGPTAVSAAVDLCELLSPSDATTLIWGWKFTQSSDTDSEQFALTVNRVTGVPTSGSGGSTLTPRPKSPGDAAYGGTVEGFNTTQLSGGTAVQMDAPGMNVLTGEEWVAADRADAIEVSPGTYMVWKIPAPADALTISFRIEIEEVGG